MPSLDSRPDSRPAQFMFSSLQATHQHADTKAGILAAAQAALVGTAGSWSPSALDAAAGGGPTGVLAATLLALFVCAMFGGAGFLAATLRPRVQRPDGANRYSFAHLATGADILPPTRPGLLPSAQPGSFPPAQAASFPPAQPGLVQPASAAAVAAVDEERGELSRTIRFLSQVALRKYRCVTGAVTCTAVMGVCAGLLVVLRPLWG
ncbi:Pycsar system effector family protein [Streptomyces sp. bgisy153]|uniref:Pycsar system effector family protein n=1 Tax=Streptomyces sp. bgisy153 TaxID=3413793 RepID=UPI003D765708